MSVMDMTSAVLGMIPGLDQPVYLNQEPDESEMPPWVIAACTTDGHRSTEAARYTAHVGRLEIRVVDLTADAVNVICDDRIIPAMKYRVPAKNLRVHGRAADPRRGFRRVRGRPDRRRHVAPLSGARPAVPLHVDPPVDNQSFTRSLQGHPIRGGLSHRRRTS